MKKMKPFKEEYSFEDRCEESKEIIAKYPERVPIVPAANLGSSLLVLSSVADHCYDYQVIAERFARSDLPGMEKRKYLVPRDMSIGQFIHILSCRLHLAPGKALFVFVNNTLPQTSSLVESIYESYKDEDGFLYMYYSSEKTFG
ncbi:hypothetical protein IEQ34_011834 [Dendrobium chrysotoxum]|uniref:Autophagy-related protein n=1 Tax=Dendrobium chrysotoxum TaxID=161865 RepID=A0AAV7GUU5_DENCH|nr:hypothetical protein IEQ34_011834 [Dendrobium chrysotoxum]